jgi:hypothetical protein
MREISMRNVASMALAAFMAACGGGGGGGGTPPPVRAQAPSYDVIAEVLNGGPSGTVTFRKLDGSVISTHTVCRVSGKRAAAITPDGYVRIRCSLDPTVLEFNPTNWLAAPVAIREDTLIPQGYLAIISYGPNGEEFYNKTVFEAVSGKPIDTFFRVSGSSGQRIAQDLIVLPNYMIATKIVYSDDRKKAYLLASDGSSNNAVYEIDLGTFAIRQIVTDDKLIWDIELNGTHLVYTRIRPATQPLDDMLIVDIATGQVVRSFDFGCPFPGTIDFGGKIVQAGANLIVGSGRCHHVFRKADYALTLWDYPRVNVGPQTIIVNVIPEFYDGTQLWNTYQLQLEFSIAAYDVSTWLSDSTPKVFVPGTLGNLVHLVH